MVTLLEGVISVYSQGVSSNVRRVNTITMHVLDFIILFWFYVIVHVIIGLKIGTSVTSV